jgi:hypothetical protein
VDVKPWNGLSIKVFRRCSAAIASVLLDSYVLLGRMSGYRVTMDSSEGVDGEEDGVVEVVGWYNAGVVAVGIGIMPLFGKP